MNKVSNKNDLFSRVHEDPMMMIKKEEKKVKQFLIFSRPLFNRSLFLLVATRYNH
jgi:hypothetical protein